jgi:hypothetical protein
LRYGGFEQVFEKEKVAEMSNSVVRPPKNTAKLRELSVLLLNIANRFPVHKTSHLKLFALQQPTYHICEEQRGEQ